VGPAKGPTASQTISILRAVRLNRDPPQWRPANGFRWKRRSLPFGKEIIYRGEVNHIDERGGGTWTRFFRVNMTDKAFKLESVPAEMLTLN